ncbi:uracil-DNA glycosylase family protein [Tenacibaculum soleae]|uniref:uracil-DNA glycosylase family protein n=1 Tax=Tenacibaculum soleae TaxID=447689 RepID=UPI00159F147D|nr:uracil-DNA glycosylase family protein [Tenacibaculum soleae]
MKYEKEIRNENLKDSYTKEDLMKEKYLVSKEGKIEIYYAPFDYINLDASIIIVGITPGWSQMEKSFKTIIKEMKVNNDFSLALKKVKSECSFAGSMRNNLIKMLDKLELEKKLNIKSTSELFEIENSFLHSTSIIKYPVFNNGKNYTGSTPSPLKSEILWKQIEKLFIPEISEFKGKLIIPLGKSVSEILLKIQSENKLNGNFILNGFPHPSGANGHRAKQFETNKESMKEIIKEWKIKN